MAEQAEVTFEEIVRFEIDTFYPRPPRSGSRSRRSWVSWSRSSEAGASEASPLAHVREVLHQLRAPAEAEPVTLPSPARTWSGTEHVSCLPPRSRPPGALAEAGARSRP